MISAHVKVSFNTNSLLLDDIRTTAHIRFLASKNIHRFVESELFENVYIECNDGEKEIIKNYIDNLNKDSLVGFIKNKLINIRNKNYDYSTMPILMLRDIAQNLSVPYYWNLTKDALLSEISKRLSK